MPLEKCAVLPDCTFFGFVGNPSLGNVYLAPAARRKPAVISDTQMTDFNLPDRTVQKEVFFIYARDALQCADDFICSWYAFQNTVLRPVSINGRNLQAVTRRLPLPITWHIQNADTDATHHIRHLMRQLAAALPAHITQAADQPQLLFTGNSHAQNIFSTASRSKSAQPISRFDTRRSQKHILQKTGTHPFTHQTDGATQVIVPVAGEKPSAYLLPADFLTALGLHADLDHFPFSVLNNPAADAAPQGWPDLTALDLLLVKALYHPAFDKPLPLAEAKKSFKIFHESVRLEKQ